MHPKLSAMRIPAAEVRGPAVTGGIAYSGRARAHRLTTFTSDISFMVRTSSEAAASCSGCPMPADLGSTASAPASTARKAITVSPMSGVPLTMTIGVGRLSMIRRVASNPSILGMWISMVITSGLLRSTACSASSPFDAVATT